jgi:predicted ATPase
MLKLIPPTFKVAFSGCHSTGKTTLMNEVAEKIRKKYGFHVEIVSEVARNCPYPINKVATPQAEQWIFYHQILAENTAAVNLKVSGKKGLVLSDRTIFDTLAYSFNQRKRDKKEGKDVEAWSWVFNFYNDSLEELLPYYNLIFVTQPWSESLVKDDGLRDTDSTWRDEISEAFEGMWDNIIHSKFDKGAINYFTDTKSCTTLILNWYNSVLRRWY